ncbi:ornithine cyclodeaminase family protein [Streptomyces sp. NPDC007162]|uniref:ornithine cyclodeaminase family protein n=1 Tax=Streptomyces sp. NPDC007162 TaxID=3156917 RepID=UPI0033F4C5C3
MANGIPVLRSTPDIPAERLLAALRTAFTDLARGKAAQPVQVLTPLSDGGDVIAYQGVLDGMYGVKVSPYLPHATDGPLVTAWTLLMSTKTGQPVLLVDSKELTALRTGATTALAVDLLAREESAVLAIIGTGPLAQAHLRYAREVRPFTDVRVYSPAVAAGRQDTGFDSEVRVASGVDEAVEGADVVLLCTSAAEPLLDAAALPAGTLITSISTNAPRAHEIAPVGLPGLDVYGDHRPTVTASAGEMVLAAEQGLWSGKDLRGDLPELLTDACPPPSGERPVFFRSIGLGIEDIAVARLLIEG